MRVSCGVLGWMLLVLPAGAAGQSFVLPDQTSGVYYTLTVAAGEGIELESGVRVRGGSQASGGLVLELVMERSEIPLGAPVLAALRIENRTGKVAELDLGKSLEGNVVLDVVGPESHVEGARKRFDSGLSFPGLTRLKPGQVHRQTLVLNDWYEGFDRPGEYSISVRLLPEGDLRASASLRITPADAGRMKDICSSLEERALQLDAVTALKASEALSHVADVACLPNLAHVLKESFHAKPGAVRALARIGTAEAIQILVDGWDGLLAGYRAVALNSLSAEQRQALISALTRAGKEVMPEDPWSS